MITPIGGTTAALSSGSATPSSPGLGQGFDAALAAAEKAKARQEAQDAELKSIREKGFTAWVRDTTKEKLKEELRKRVMASMGLTEDDLSKMSGAMQSILEQKIKDEVEKRLAQALNGGSEDSGAKASDSSRGTGQTTLSGQAQGTNAALAAQETATETPATTGQAGKNSRDGIYCPVIPALVMSGGTPLF